MAVLTLSDAITPFASGWRGSGVQIKTFTGTGTTATTVAAAADDTRYVIVGGHMSFEAAASLIVNSDTTLIDLYKGCAAKLHKHFVPGLETATGEALVIRLTAETIHGWIAYMPVKAGQIVPGF